MIKVEHLTKEFGSIKAVSDVSFTVERGQILGFLGPNGAGKTTTMRMLCGIFPPTTGRAEISGFDLTRDPIEIRKRIGYLPEQVPLYPELRVREYLDFVCSLWTASKAERIRRIDEALNFCGLIEEDQTLLGRLSRGYRQRVGLAQALVHDPEILILDEPTVGLDPKQIREIRDLIKSFKGKKTVILSTHILPEVSMTCDKVVIIDQGKVVAEGTPESLTQSVKKTAEVEIEVQGPPDEISKVLSAISGVRQVNVLQPILPGHAKLVLQTREGLDLRPEIARAIVQRNWGLLEMHLHALTLEDIFLKLVTQEEAS